MLYIHYTLPPSSVPDVGGMKEREWHVGDAAPSEQLDDNDIQIHTIPHVETIPDGWDSYEPNTYNGE